MSARLLILLVCAGGLGVYLTMRSSAPPAKKDGSFSPAEESGLSAEERRLQAEIDETKVELTKRPLPGPDPTVPPEFDIRVEVDAASGKNRLVFYITEAHGYYVEHFNIDFWYVNGPDVTGPQNSPLPLNHRLDKYLKAGETFKDCIEVVDAELRRVDGGMGKSENWAARVRGFGRAREKNPDPLPKIVDLSPCR